MVVRQSRNADDRGTLPEGRLDQVACDVYVLVTSHPSLASAQFAAPPSDNCRLGRGTDIVTGDTGRGLDDVESFVTDF